ncbi:MAG: xylulose kinase [Frankiales bacterium]|nr:xylulose kinase [Frankiales bacterium]
MLSEAYLPSTFTPPVRAPDLDVHLNVIKIGRITAGFLRFGDAMRIRTAEAANYHLDIPTAGSSVMRSGQGRPVYATPSTGTVFMPGRSAELDCDPDCAQICLMFPRNEIHAELESLLGAPASRPLEFSRPMDLAAPAGATFVETLRLIDLATVPGNRLLEHPLAALRLEQTLTLALLLTQPNNYSAVLDKTPKPSGRRPVAHAIELIRARPEHPWTVATLAAEVAVSVRSLQAGFARSVGQTPMRYLQQVRLERVHAELARAEPGATTITEAATWWGFTHLGRFAHQYRTTFGELPSATLTRNHNTKFARSSGAASRRA